MGSVCGKDSHHKNKTKSPEKEKAFKPEESDMVQGKLMNLRDELFEKKKGLNLSVDKADAQIKDLIKNKKADSAKYLIKCKKLYEEYLKIVEDKYIFTQKMIIEVQKKIMDKSLVDVMKDTNALLKDIQKSIDVDDMHEMMDNFEKNKEISDLFKKYNAVDEEAIDKEYDLIEAKMQFQNISTQPIINKENLVNKKTNKEENHQNVKVDIKKDRIDEQLADLA